MPARKRVIDEVDTLNNFTPQPVDPLLNKIRNMWQFASLMQYIYMFGDVLKISKDIDVETLEMECCKSGPSEVLANIGLALLKFVSSHRGLTTDLFDEYTRRQYHAKAPSRPNPFGYDEEPRKFADFPITLKLKVLHQLSVWTLYNPDRIRQALADEDPTTWRMEPLGWDRHDKSYYLLDDNRLYRKTDAGVSPPPKKQPAPQKQKQKPAPPPPPPKPKGSRSSKRQKLANGLAADSDEEILDQIKRMAQDPPAEAPIAQDETAASTPVKNEEVEDEEENEQDNGLGGAKWELIAITLQEYQDFANSIKSSKDLDEKALRDRLINEAFPTIEKLAVDQERKAAQKRREFENLQRLAFAKRSSRIADKHEREKEQRELDELERKRQEEVTMAKKEQARQRKIEEDRESRMLTREQRLRDRETKRVLGEQQLAELESQSQTDNPDSRLSERNLKQQLDSKRKELEDMTKSDEDWYFDCAICGIHGKNLDDGSHSIACEKCDVWQHSACHGIKEEEAEREDFHFLCSTCQQPRPLKINIGTSTTAEASAEASAEPTTEKPKRQRGRPKKSLVPGTDQPKKRGRPRKSLDGEPGGVQKKPKSEDKPPGERKKRPKKPKLDPSLPQTNGVSPAYSFPHDPSQPQNGATAASSLYQPSKGHFPPPAPNGLAPRPHQNVFYNYHQGSYSPSQYRPGPTAQPARPGQQSPPQTQHTNGLHLNNISNITWHNQSASHYPPGPSAPHNPYLNDFARQRISPQADRSSHHSPSASFQRPQSSYNDSPPQHPQNYRPNPNSGAYSSYSTNFPAVPRSPAGHEQPHQPKLPPIAASPTPSFSATQGNTTVKFSPTQTPSNSLSSSNSVSHATPAGSYAPASNMPTSSAVSPVKQASSPPLPLPSLSPNQGPAPTRTAPIPKFDSPPQSSAAGVSPVKQDLPPANPQLPSPSTLGLGITDANRPVMAPFSAPAAHDVGSAPSNSQVNETDARPSKPPTSMQHLLNNNGNDVSATKPSTDIRVPHRTPDALPPPTTLSPSIGLNNVGEPAPKKADLPSSVPALPPTAAPAIESNSNHIQSSSLPEPSKSPNPTTDHIELPPPLPSWSAKPDPEPVKSPSPNREPVHSTIGTEPPPAASLSNSTAPAE